MATETNESWGNAAEVPGTATLNVGGDAEVNSVSCGAAGDCAAGGFYSVGTGHREAFVASETNGAWGDAIEVPGTAALNSLNDAEMTSVSCAAAGECAAGGYYTDGNVQAFVVSETNGSWGDAVGVPGTATLNSGGYAQVTSVSCGEAGDCAAGGFYVDADGHHQAFVADETNDSWTDAVEVPGTAALNSGGYAHVNSVACASAGNCVAGGLYRTGSYTGPAQAFVASETDGSWGDAVKVPGTAALNTGGDAAVNAVSCSSAGDCAAGGYYGDASGYTQAFMASETTGSWGDAVGVSDTAALNSGAYYSSVLSVSCAAAGSCAAGGFDYDCGNWNAFILTNQPQPYGITYDGNGADGGSVPSDASSPYTYGTTVTVLGAGGLTRTGYTFSGWNAAANGGCTSYQQGDSFSMPASAVTLYAQWTLAKPALSSSPVVSGKAAVGSQLSTTAGAWANGPTRYLYRWQRCDSTGSNCIDIANATNAWYPLVLADAGHTIRSEVLAGNAAGLAASGFAPSAATSVVVRKPALITRPTLSGVAKVGKLLSVTVGTWKYAPTHYAYKWLRCSKLGTPCKTIAGATRRSYRLTPADAGHKLKATVTASNAAGSVTATSNTSAAIKS